MGVHIEVTRMATNHSIAAKKPLPFEPAAPEDSD